MPTAKPSLIFFGNEQLALGIKPKTPIFNTLLSKGYHIDALILSSRPPRQAFPIEKVAKTHKIPVIFTKNDNKILHLIKKYQPTLGVLAAYGKFIPDHLISAFPLGILNVHPSLLPRYRGTTPIESTLLNGDPTTGVSIMQLTRAMDAGPLLAQTSVPLSSDTTKQQLYEQLATLGASLLAEHLPSYLTGSTPLIPQNDQLATFTVPLDKSSRLLDPDHKTAFTLAREVIAFAGFPKSKITLRGKLCTITAAHVAKQPSSPLDLCCADQNYLVIDQLIPENSKPMSATAFLNGLKHQN